MRYTDLADYLSQTGTSQADFAARVGLGQSAISRILHGHRAPSLRAAVRIAAAARIPITSLIERGRASAKTMQAQRPNCNDAPGRGAEDGDVRRRPSSLAADRFDHR